MGQGIEGKVVWFNNSRGLGFLSREGGPDVFCHFSSIECDGYRSLKEGERVRYDIGQGTKGPQAEHVERLRGGGNSVPTAAGVTEAAVVAEAVAVAEVVAE